MFVVLLTFRPSGAVFPLFAWYSCYYPFTLGGVRYSFEVMAYYYIVLPGFEEDASPVGVTGH